MVKETKEIKENKKEDCNFMCKIKANLKWIIPVCIAFIALIVVLIIVIFGNKSNEKELKSNLKTLGGQFYENFYYPAQEKAQKDIKEFMNKFEKTGIKVNLINIAKVSKVDQDLVKGMVNSKTKEECDKEASYVIIKPKKPFGKKDYSVEAYLSCGFEDNKDTKKTTDTKKETKTTEKKDTTTTKTSEKTSTKATTKSKK